MKRLNGAKHPAGHFDYTHHKQERPTYCLELLKPYQLVTPLLARFNCGLAGYEEATRQIQRKEGRSNAQKGQCMVLG
jgi:hypothetical protein